ncbi:MAG: GNAT family N-acetyltransferase [Bacteroidia bacterium]
MIVEQYGLIYSRVTEQDLETLRYWRNQSFIRDTMQFKDYITPTMQKNWFQKINNKYNYYFIIYHHHKKIGLINCKDTSENKVAEGGIFIWDKSYWGTAIPVFASLTMLQAVFKVFQSGEVSIATVACDNKLALDFNLKLGYEIKDTTPDGKYYKLILSKERFFSHCQKLIRASAIMSNNQSEFILTGEESPLQSDEINNYIAKQKFT